MKHAFVSAKSDGADNTLVQPSDWNAAHVSTVVDHGTMGASEDFDFSDGTDHAGTLDENLTVTLSGATNGEAAWMTLRLLQDGSGGNTIDLPASVANAAGVEAAFNTAANALNVITVFSYDGGTTWLAFLAGESGNLASDRKVRSSGDYTLTGAGSTSFSDVDATNMSITLTTGARRCAIKVVATGSVNNVAGAFGLDIDLDGARLGGTTAGLAFQQVAVSGEAFNLSFATDTDVLSAGSHTFKLQWIQANASHTATLRGSDPKLIFSVVEQYA